MRYEFVLSETGRRGAEIVVDGLGEITLWKKRVTRNDADAFDSKIKKLTDKIIGLSGKLAKAKGDARKKITLDIFDANAEFICARVDGITEDQLSIVDASDVAEISVLANKLYEDTFDAKKNG